MADPGGSSRIPGGIRARTTAIAVLAVAVTLAVAALVLVGFVRASLRENAQTDARVRANAIVDELEARGDFTPGDAEGELVQVVAADGTVVAASPNVEGRPAIVPLPVEEVVLDEAPIPDTPILVLARDAMLDGRPATVLLGRSLEVVSEATRAIVAVLAVALPAVLLVVGALTWFLVGRVLAPVESIRREAATISPAELHRRVPDPPGRDEIARLARTMNAMLARLDEGQRRERRLVSDASHELRSPIASIRQHAEVAMSHPEASSLPELAETVLHEGVRLQRIVDDLLLLSSLDEGSLRMRSEPVDLDDLLFDEAGRMRASGSLRIDVHEVSGGRVVGDRSMLERLVRNLSDNAVRHARSGVALSLHQTDGRVVLVVEDDGPGVPEPDRERIFERFVRRDEARDREAGGSGLGLAIVRDVAAAHGATVRVTDGALGGARFVVDFPAVATPAGSGSFRGGSGPARQPRVHPDDDPATGSRR